MVSINTSNNGVALAALRRVNNELNNTQNRIATGYRVNSAKDNAAVWATATKIRSDATASDAVKSGISTAKAQVDAAVSALDEISSLVEEVSAIQAAITASGVAATDAQGKQVKAIAAQITALIDSAGVGGKNILKTGNNLAVATGVADGALTGTISYTSAAPTAGAGMTELMAIDDGTKLTAFIAADMTAAKDEISALTSQLGAMSKGFDSSLNFLDKMADIRTNALGGLIDADMERETAKMQALQVRQQLAYQALSMTSNSAQNILMLFR